MSVGALAAPAGNDGPFRTITRAQGAVRASLGPRTLRAETDAIAAVTLLQARYGDLG